MEKVAFRRRFRFFMKESEGGYITFEANGGDIEVSGVTTTDRCRDRECVKQLVRNMIKAPESPPAHIREMAESVLRHLLQLADEVSFGTSFSTSVSTYIDGEEGPELSLSVSIDYAAPPKTYHDEEDYWFDDDESEWYITIESCYRGFDTHYCVKRILRLGIRDPLDLRINANELRRVVITTVKQAYNAW
jgi:hypothetical protein